MIAPCLLKRASLTSHSEEVLEAWRLQGMPDGAALSELFAIDERDEIEPDLYPSPDLEPWPTSLDALGALEGALDPDELARLPEPVQRRAAPRAQNA